MKPINIKVHGIIDYAMAIVLLSIPLLFHFPFNAIQSKILFAMGGTLLLYSLLTKYEYGVLHLIPINIHLMLDVISGIFLAASPWLFGFSSEVFFPHLFLGLAEIIIAVSTNPRRIKYF